MLNDIRIFFLFYRCNLGRTKPHIHHTPKDVTYIYSFFLPISSSYSNIVLKRFAIHNDKSMAEEQ